MISSICSVWFCFGSDLSGLWVRFRFGLIQRFHRLGLGSVYFSIISLGFNDQFMGVGFGFHIGSVWDRFRFGLVKI